MPGLFDQVAAHLGSEDETQGSPVIFNRLNTQLEKIEGEGITTLDLVSLARPQKLLMLFLLRDSEAALLGIASNDIEQRMPDAPENLSQELAELTRTGWLIPLGETPNIRYRVHMRRKKGSTLGFGIWSILNERLPQK
jgi:hypothetical protein